MEGLTELEDYERKHEFLTDFAYVIRDLNEGNLKKYRSFDYLLLLGKRGYSLSDVINPNFNLALDFVPYSEGETIEDIINMVVEDQDSIKILLPDIDYPKNIPFYERIAEKIQLAMLIQSSDNF